MDLVSYDSAAAAAAAGNRRRSARKECNERVAAAAMMSSLLCGLLVLCGTRHATRTGGLTVPTVLRSLARGQLNTTDRVLVKFTCRCSSSLHRFVHFYRPCCRVQQTLVLCADCSMQLHRIRFAADDIKSRLAYIQ
jgi:hypothetical protein